MHNLYVACLWVENNFPPFSKIDKTFRCHLDWNIIPFLMLFSFAAYYLSFAGESSDFVWFRAIDRTNGVMKNNSNNDNIVVGSKI